MACILITHGVPMEGFDRLIGHELIFPKRLSAFSHEELMCLIPRADAVVACGKLTEDVIYAGKKLSIIANYGAGYDGVDVNAARKAGVYVTNIPDTVTQDTAELAIGLMLSVSRRIGEMNVRVRCEESASLFGMGRYMGKSLRGLTLGIIGCGRIGTRVAMLAKAFGMRVLGYSRSGADPAHFEPCGLNALLSQSDVISLHCPLTEETRNLIDREAFERMKEGAILINTSRGAVVDHDQLTAHLKSGRLSGAGLDVFPDEPNIPKVLTELQNVVLTPHIGTNTHQTRFDMARAISKQILDALNGIRPQNIVNGL